MRTHALEDIENYPTVHRSAFSYLANFELGENDLKRLIRLYGKRTTPIETRIQIARFWGDVRISNGISGLVNSLVGEIMDDDIQLGGGYARSLLLLCLNKYGGKEDREKIRTHLTLDRLQDDQLRLHYLYVFFCRDELDESLARAARHLDTPDIALLLRVCHDAKEGRLTKHKECLMSCISKKRGTRTVQARNLPFLHVLLHAQGKEAENRKWLRDVTSPKLFTDIQEQTIRRFLETEREFDSIASGESVARQNCVHRRIRDLIHLVRMSDTQRIGQVKFDSNRQSVRSMADLYRNGLLNPNPVFQRRSVWRQQQREHLIDSVFHGYPIPAIFLYKHIDENTGTMMFEVIDGKQRLETLFMYTGAMRGKFAVSLQLPNSDRPQVADWSLLRKSKQQSRIEEYQLQVIQVEADLCDIIELFVRINSTGNALTRQEIRNAHFYRSEFLKTAKRLATRYEAYLQGVGAIGAQQVRRMKHIELLSELLYSAHIEGLANKKRVLDSAMRNHGLKGIQLLKAERATTTSLNRLRRMFPELSRAVRFHKISDFYSLTVVIQDLERRGFVLDNKKRNRLAWDLLVALSVGVDELAMRSRKLDFKSLSPREELFRQYLQAVREGSDTEVNRRKRHDIICGLIEPIFERKDAKRVFSSEQRRILWNTAEERVCKQCRRQLTWADFQADHIRPFASGGKTDLANAAILCVEHNAKKGKGTRAAVA
jgi:hypothetical protein